MPNQMNAPMSQDAARGVAGSSPRVMVMLALCVLVGIVLRGLEAGGKSLWLDEYHTLWLADSSSLGAVADKVKHDFRPPLFFWAMSALRGLDPHVQRWVPILFSMLTLLPLWSIARAGGLGRVAAVTACGVFLFAPYQVQYGAELRSYSAVQLASVSLVWAAVTSSAAVSVRLAVFGVVTAIGLYLHYGVAVAVLSVGFARCLVRPVGSVSLPAMIGAGTLGVLAFLPWLVSVEGWLFSDPEQILSPEDRGPADPAAVDESPAWWDHELDKAAVVLPRTLVPMIGALGPVAGGVMKVAAGLLFIFVAVGSVCVARRVLGDRERAGNKAVWAALLTSGAAFVLTTLLCVGFWQRVPMQYYVVASWGWPLFLGLAVHCCGTRRGAARFAAGLLVAGLAAGLCQSVGDSREDTEAGVRAALEVEAENPIYTAVLWQPPWYPHTTPWLYGDLPAGLDVREPRDVPGGAAAEQTVVVVTRRSRPEDGGQDELWGPIIRERELRDVVEIDDVTRVYVYSGR